MLQHPNWIPEIHPLLFSIKNNKKQGEKKKNMRTKTREPLIQHTSRESSDNKRVLTVSPWMPEYRWFLARSHPSASTWHKTLGLLSAHAYPASVKRFFFCACSMCGVLPQHTLMMPDDMHCKDNILIFMPLMNDLALCGDWGLQILGSFSS